MKRVPTVLVSLAVAAACFLVSAPAASAARPWRGVITFDKNWQSPSNSRLVWQLYQRQGNRDWKVVETRSWRSGSSMLGKHGRNSCVTNKGWLPNGTYAVKQYNDYHGNTIKGRAFRLEDKSCPTGQWRHNLFIHTEQGARNSQCRNGRGDQVCRWELPRYNEYKSAGCIKLAPGHLAELVRSYQRHFVAGVRYSKDQVVLRVVN